MATEALSEEDKIKERRSLIGKVFTDRFISKETIRGTIAKIWRICKPIVFKEAGKNMFVVTFATEIDKQRVINGKL